jgi:hypothetical protein
VGGEGVNSKTIQKTSGPMKVGAFTGKNPPCHSLLLPVVSDASSVEWPKNTPSKWVWGRDTKNKQKEGTM